MKSATLEGELSRRCRLEKWLLRGASSVEEHFRTCVLMHKGDGLAHRLHYAELFNR